MNESLISQLCISHFSEPPRAISRYAQGIGNYVYRVQCAGKIYIFRCGTQPDAYKDTVYYLEKLAALHVPVPRVLGQGHIQDCDYLILSYIEGEDIGQVYPQLTRAEKQSIAKTVVDIQERTALLELEDVTADWSWYTFLREMLDRAEERITRNGYFDPEKVARLRKAVRRLEHYFSTVRPIAYLDDISSKNLLIHEGQVSGVIDIDSMGIGDKLTYVALTNMALLDLGYDRDYVEDILEEMGADDEQRQAFLFYTLLYCVDFMGERGMTFTDKQVAVSPAIIHKLNGIYDRLWEQWRAWTEARDNGRCSHCVWSDI